jgi:hypothetical protein
MKKEVNITIGGKEYAFRFGISAMCKLEALTGKPVSEIKGNSMTEIRALIASGIKPAMTVEEAGDFMDEAIEEVGMDGLMKIVNEAMGLAFGEAESKKQVSKNPKK